MHNDNIRIIKKLIKKKDTWEISQSLPLQRKLTFLPFENLVSNRSNRNVSPLRIFPYYKIQLFYNITFKKKIY